MLMAVDDDVSALMNKLSEMGQLDNTIVVMTSDHGYWHGEYDLSAERRLTYEEGLRIPLFVRYPKTILAGTRLGHMVLSLDLASTLLDFGGIRHGQELHGMSP